MKSIRKRTLRACKNCEKIYTGSEDSTMCPECASKSKISNVVRNRICIDCGSVFMGGPRARRCPTCREAERIRYSRNRKKTIRPIGSIDICPICGHEYAVTSGRQKYCSDACQKTAVMDWQRNQKREYAKRPEVKLAKQERLSERQKVCIYCLKKFWTSTSTAYCSDYCRKQQNKIQNYQADIKRGANCNIQKLMNQQEEYRKQLVLKDI